MGSGIDTTKFSEMVKSKRGNIGLRTLSAEIGISPATLSRIEQANLPDIDTYLKLCDWLEVNPDFFKLNKNNVDEKSVVIAHLRADKILPSQTAEALIQMINLAYASTQIPK